MNKEDKENGFSPEIMNIEDTDEQTCDLIFFYLKQLAARNS